MATLNTLRTRMGFIVSGVIFLALLSFLLGDLNRQGKSMLNSRKMRVGRIDGTYVSYTEFSSAVDRYTTITKIMSGKEATSTEEQDNIRNSAWQSLVNRYALRPGFATLGLTPGVDEQVDMVSGVFLSPVITGTFRDPHYGMFDPEMLRGFIANTRTDASGQAGMLWDFLKEQMVDQRTMAKYMALVSKALYVTDAEAKEGVRQSNYGYDINFVTLPFSSIPDSTVKISDGDISAYFNANQKQFERTASRDVKYVLFTVTPSEGDYAAAKEKVDGLAAEFRTTADPMQYANLNSQATPETRFVSASALDPAIAAAVFDKPGGMFGPELKNDVYTMARLSAMKMLPDSVGARHILLPAGQQARADSLVKVLHAGGDFAKLAAQFSVDRNSSENGGQLGKFDPQQMVQPLGDELMKAAVGEIFTSVTRYGVHVVQLTYKSPLVKKAQVATVTFNVEASPATEQKIYGQASKFYTAAAGSLENFDKAASQQGLLTRNAHIRNTDRLAGGLPDSREVVRWAFNADKGTISSIMEIGNDYVVAALTDKADDGIAPLASVSDDIRTILIQQKKGDMLAGKLTSAGGSLEAIAPAVGAEVKQAQDIRFESFFINGVGVEMQLIGAVGKVGKAGVLSAPVRGNSGVFLFDITNVKQVDQATPASERVRLEAAAQNYVDQRAGQAFMEESRILDNRVKFF